ncbi:MAG: MarR family transcriptional regulator [Chloroflexi bacterium]|nr:MAG: MarR family transcriptional regulator [Chloroflexota bacterium]
MSGSAPATPEWDDIRIAAMLRKGWRRAQATMTKALAVHDLTGLEYHLLLVVSAAGKTGMRQVDLAQELSVPEARVSVLARELGDRGLIEALRSEPDRRYVRIRLRPSGRRVLREAMRCQREQLVAMVGELPEDSMVLPMIEFVCRTYLGLDVTVQAR